MLFRDVREVQEVGEGAGQWDRRIDRQLAELGRQRLKVAIGAGPRGLRDRSHALDRLEEPLALLLDEDRAEGVAEQADVAPELRRSAQHRVKVLADACGGVGEHRGTTIGT